MKSIFQRFFSPYSTVRHTTISVCGMLRFGCATSSVFIVRHAPIYAINRDGTLGWFDTPLFNGESRLFGSEARNGTACIPGGKCYNRTELNYIGEGEALAAMGFSKEDTHKIVWTWKNAKNIGWCALGVECKFREPSQGTYEMTDVGWEFYNQYYSQSDPYPPSYPPHFP